MKILPKVEWLPKTFRLYNKEENNWGKYQWEVGSVSKKLQKTLKVFYNRTLGENFTDITIMGHACKSGVEEHTDLLNKKCMLIPVVLKCKAVFTVGKRSVELKEGVPVIFNDWLPHSVCYSDKEVTNKFITIDGDYKEV